MKESSQKIDTNYFCNLLQQKFRTNSLLQRNYHCNNLILILLQSIVMTRAVLGLGRVEFGLNPYLTRLDQVTKNLTRTRPNIRVEPDGLGQWFGWSDLSVWWV